MSAHEAEEPRLVTAKVRELEAAGRRGAQPLLALDDRPWDARRHDDWPRGARTERFYEEFMERE
jgi:hypothetical protein